MRLTVTENIIFRKMISDWPQISPLTRKWISPLIFTSIHFRKKRERERERAHARGEDPVRDRELPLQSDGAIDGEIAIAIAPSIVILRHRDLGSRSLRDCDRDRDLRLRSWIAIAPWSRSCVVIVDDFFSWVVALCFPSSFPNTRKYFSENFLKCNQTHGNIFLFRKLAFPKNMYFPENVLQQPNTA